jgi:hypothetical protein
MGMAITKTTGITIKRTMTSRSTVVEKCKTDRHGPLRCSLLMLEYEEPLK